MECLRLRVQDIDFGGNQIIVRDGKGGKDRRTMLPASLKPALEEHLRQVKAVHDQDLAEDFGRVQMPDALDRKYPTTMIYPVCSTRVARGSEPRRRPLSRLMQSVYADGSGSHAGRKSADMSAR